ncbi:hypothetical protein C7271_10345 [filamentous cyanobacterium CCP5]|nr:hypothetical protein C7271_10345 [filamentous cyanobacterium CCP5]
MRFSLEDAGTLVILGLGILLLVLGPTMIDLFELLTLTKYLILSLFAMSLAYIWGFGGIISFGQSAFFGLGGYAFGVAGLNMMGDTTTPLILSVLFAGGFAAALGYFMFYGRLTEVYMGIVTLVVTLILYKLIGHTAGSEYAIGQARLGGFNGMPSLPVMVDPFTGEEMWPETLFQVVLGLLLLVYVILKLIQKTRFGRVCLAIANNETRASLLGYDVRLHKVAMFAIGGGIAGLAGGLYASNEAFIDPNALTLVLDARQADEAVPVDSLLADIAALPAVESVSASLTPESAVDRQVDYHQVDLRVSGSEAYPVIADISNILAEQPDGLAGYLTGKDVVDYEAQQISKRDLIRAEAVALPLTLIALVIIFGSVVAAILPVAMALITVSVTGGLIYGIAQITDVSIFSINLTTMLGLGIGIDFTLVMISRFREELADHSVEQAVVRTVETAGESVFYSGLTTCIGLVSLLIFPVVLLRSLGIAGSLVVFVSILAALTLVPALLGSLGHGINRWQVIRPAAQRGEFWAGLARRVIRLRVLAAAAVMAIVLVLASPFSQASWGIGDVNVLPASTQARQGVNVLEEAIGPGQAAPVWLVVSTADPGDSIFTEGRIETLYNLARDLEADDRVSSIQSLFNLSPNLDLQDYQQLLPNPQLAPPEIAQSINRLGSDTTTLITLYSETGSNDPQTRDLVEALRSRSLPDLNLAVGGTAATNLDTIQVIAQRFPWAFAAIMAVTFISLFLLFGSLLLPLKAIFFNVMAISASFGALVYIFQQGHFQNLLGFTPVGYLDILLPVVLFCVLFGLSMDYEVFLLARMKEAYDRTGNNAASIVEGLERTGGIITSSAVLTMLVTGAFALTSIIFVKALGLGIAISVAIDATLVRAILVPATMELMGHWNWWAPKSLQQLRARL